MITVTTPASSHKLTTDAKVLAAWTGSEAPDAATVDLTNLAASREIARWCRRDFVQQEYTEVLEAPERRKLVLQEYPIASVASVTVDGDAVTAYDTYGREGILMKNDDSIWTQSIYRGGLLGASVLGYDRYPEVEVQYTAGWITREMDSINYDLPEDIESAAIYFIMQLIKADRGEALGEPKGVKIGSYRIDYPAADTMTGSGSGYWAESLGDPSLPWMPLRVRRALLPYRKVSFP